MGCWIITRDRAQDICGPLGCNVLLGSHPPPLLSHLWLAGCGLGWLLIFWASLTFPHIPSLPQSSHTDHFLVNTQARVRLGPACLASCQQPATLTFKPRVISKLCLTSALQGYNIWLYSRIRIMINVGAQGSWVNLCRRCMWSEVVWPPPQERE